MSRVCTPVADMTYNVFGGTLNLDVSIYVCMSVCVCLSVSNFRPT